MLTAKVGQQGLWPARGEEAVRMGSHVWRWGDFRRAIGVSATRTLVWDQSHVQTPDTCVGLKSALGCQSLEVDGEAVAADGNLASSLCRFG